MVNRINTPMRKYIDILNEFVISPDDQGGDDGNQTILITNIIWDVEPEEEAKYPKKVTTSLYDVEEEADPHADDPDDLMSKIGQWLQNTYDWRLSDFQYRLI